MLKSLKSRNWVPWRQPPLSEVEQEVTASIKALQTLEVHEGRVSISPSEVVGQPGYLEARRQAAALVRRHSGLTNHQRFESWSDVDSVGMEAYMAYVRSSLLRQRAEGIPLGQALQRMTDVSGS
ncbi:hypothetical protein D0894_15630 [Pseudomonas monteilii]|uniref:Uncharacterized protein n=1 Tax=Pseudomonas monteilii TaxID=76759 RepID=A0A399M5J3_9PSED|nr:hypothetical protein D0894_15630 [Pseudomonas monteilii]